MFIIILHSSIIVGFLVPFISSLITVKTLYWSRAYEGYSGQNHGEDLYDLTQLHSEPTTFEICGNVKAHTRPLEVFAWVRDLQASTEIRIHGESLVEPLLFLVEGKRRGVD